MTIEVVVEQDYESMSRRAADVVVEQLRENPASLICTATGSTPTRTYQRLAEQYAESPELFAKLRVIKLDEWYGLAMDDAASCESYLQQRLIKPLSIPPERFISFESDPADPQTECRRIADDLEREGPIDLAIVGLGVNGHLGFNEPGEHTKDHAHVAELEEVTRQHSMLAHSSLEDVRTTIRLGLTLGMADIIEARHVLLLVNGPHKAEPLRRILDSGQPSSNFPASYLWTCKYVTCLSDRSALPYTTEPT